MNNVYEIITNRILEELGKGNIPWRKPWICVGVLHASHIPPANHTAY